MSTRAQQHQRKRKHARKALDAILEAMETGGPAVPVSVKIQMGLASEIVKRARGLHELGKLRKASNYVRWVW